MANKLYPKGKEHLLNGDIDLINDTIKAILVDTADYTYADADEALDDVTGAGIVATATLGTKSTTNGVFDAADITYSSVTGDSCEALVIYLDSGVAGTSYLIAYIDTATGLPVTPNGGDIDVVWDSGASKIFAL